MLLLPTERPSHRTTRHTSFLAAVVAYCCVIHARLQKAITKAYVDDEYDEQHLDAECEAQRVWERGKIAILARHLPTGR